MTGSQSAGLPPVSAPGWYRAKRQQRKYRRRATIVLSTVWLFAAIPVWMYVQQTASVTDVLVGAVGLLLSFFLIPGWVALSSRFKSPLIRYPVSAVGSAKQTTVYRHFGGTETPDGRVVTADAYHDCAECGVEFVDGIRVDAESHIVCVGVPLISRQSSSSYYCRDCRAADWGGTEVSLDTVDLHNPDRTTLDVTLPESWTEADGSSEKV